jgi:hypothetical protein
LLADPSLSSIQVTFHTGDAQAAHSMPPGGFRLAVVNCWSLDAGRAAAAQLRNAILGTS